MFKKILFITMVLFFSQLSCLDTLNDAYDAESDIPRIGLVGEWLFDSNGTEITYDTSNNGNDGVKNTVGATPPAFPLLTTGHNGAENSAYSFTTNNDSIKINANSTLKFKYITVSFFIYPTSDGKIIMKDDEGTSPTSYQIELNGTNAIEFKCFNDLARGYDLLISDAITMNTWHHIACSFDGSMMRINIDGRLNKEQAWTGINPYLNEEVVQSTYIGRVKGDVINALSFTGKIDNIRIYNRALSANEIKLLASE